MRLSDLYVDKDFDDRIKRMVSADSIAQGKLDNEVLEKIKRPRVVGMIKHLWGSNELGTYINKVLKGQVPVGGSLTQAEAMILQSISASNEQYIKHHNIPQSKSPHPPSPKQARAAVWNDPQVAKRR